MQLLKEFLLNDSCSYLDDKEQISYYKVIEGCSTHYCQELIERGYRRFGKMYFRPVCQGCDACESIKIDVANFNFSKSARRVLRKASALHTTVQRPHLSQEHLDLFEKYHKHMHLKKGWDYNQPTPEHYYSSFVTGAGEFGYEVLYFDDEKLIGVDLIDILEDGISSIYFYYDPDYAEYSLGRLSLYNQIRYAKEANLSWIYLGYYVKECPSLSYKADYKPFVTLQGRPLESEPFIWK